MDNDLAERDAFVARLLEKEEIRTRKEQVLTEAISYKTPLLINRSFFLRRSWILPDSQRPKSRN
jgi:hypothetical protein